MSMRTQLKTRPEKEMGSKGAPRLSMTTFLLSIGLAFLTVGASAALASLTISGTSITGDSSFTDIAASSGNLNAASIVVSTSSLPSGTKVYVHNSSTATGILTGVHGFAIGSATSLTSAIQGGNFEGHTGAGNTVANVVTLLGVRGISKHNATSTVLNAVGGLYQLYNESSGSISNAIGSNSQIFQEGSGTIVNAFGFLANPPTVSAGAITNYYGFYQTAASGASNNYGAYFANNVGIGTTAPLQLLNVAGIPTQSSTSSLVLFGNSNLSGGNSSGTYLGINAASGYGGDFVNFQTNSSRKFAVSASTVQVGDASSPGCLKLGSASGTPANVVYVYFDTLAAMYATTTKPSFCQ